METTKTHWKQLINYDFIGAYSLGGKDLTVKILSVSQEMVTGDKGKKELCTVAKLDGQKPFIVNRVNSKTITKVIGSPYIEDWVGKSIILYPTTTQLAGETVECLRVRQTIPTEKKRDYSVQIESLRNCNTLDELKQVYSGFSKDEQAGTLLVKDEMKGKLQ